MQTVPKHTKTFAEENKTCEKRTKTICFQIMFHFKVWTEKNSLLSLFFFFKWEQDNKRLQEEFFKVSKRGKYLIFPTIARVSNLKRTFRGSLKNPLKAFIAKSKDMGGILWCGDWSLYQKSSSIWSPHTHTPGTSILNLPGELALRDYANFHQP